MASAVRCEDVSLPSTVVTPPGNVAATRKMVEEGDARVGPALEDLMARASRALEQAPVSVVQDDLIPPSGDRHDYSSVGPYWWPNPKTKDGLPYIRKDGQVNPERKTGDNVLMGRMTGAVKTLCLAFYLTNDERYAAHATTLLRTWFIAPDTRMNPHLEYGQAIPGRCQGRGIGIIDTVCLIDLVDRVGLLNGSRHWSESDQSAMVTWFSEYLTWLLESSHGKSEMNTRNNHGSWYDGQVAAFALFAGRQERAREVLAKAGAKRLAKHIASDGRQPHELSRTKSWGYSIYNLDSLMTLALLGDRVGLDLWKYETSGRGSIRKALEYLVGYQSPDAEWPHKQIGPRRETDLIGLLLKASYGMGPDAFENALNAVPAEVFRRDERMLLYPPGVTRCTGDGR